MRREWEAALQGQLDWVRAQQSLSPNEVVPDAVLLAEASELFGEPDLWPPREWFSQRLLREADSAADRENLAAKLLAETDARRARGARFATYRLMDWPRLSKKSRRPHGRKRGRVD